MFFSGVPIVGLPPDYTHHNQISSNDWLGASMHGQQQQWKHQWLKQQLQEHHTMYFIVSGPMLPAVWSQPYVHAVFSGGADFAAQVTAGDSRKRRSTLGLEDFRGEENQVQTPTGL